MQRITLLFVCFLFVNLPAGWIWQAQVHDPVFGGAPADYVISVLVSLAAAGIASVAISVLPGRRFQLVAAGAVLLLMLALQSANVVHLWLFQHPVNASAIEAIAGTSMAESTEFLSRLDELLLAVLGAYWLGVAVVLLILAKRLWRAEPARMGSIALVSLASCLLLAMAAGLSAALDLPRVANPAELVTSAVRRDAQAHAYKALVRYWMERREFLSAVEARSGLTIDVQAGVEGELSVVLVLGEAAAMMHHSLYGYARPTTPFLSSRRDELLVLERAISPAVTSLDSIVRMLTSMSNDGGKDISSAISVINIANAAGFATYWLSNQAKLGEYDTKTSVLARDSSVMEFVSTGFPSVSYDEKLVPVVEAVLNSPGERKFIVVHLMGSHATYSRRYPVGYPGFEPAQRISGISEELSPEKRQRLAEYDTSILYTDAFLQRLIGLLQADDSPARLVYVSDHGEYVLDDNFGHGSPGVRAEHFRVPMFFWSSDDGGLGTNSESDSATRNAAHIYSTADIFHSLITMLDVQCECYRAERDILSPDFEPVPVYVRSPTRDLLEVAPEALEVM